jgi:RND family efflux transporter MFP subunit
MRKIIKFFMIILVLALILWIGFKTLQAVQARRKMAAARNEEITLPKVAVQKIEQATVRKTVPITSEVNALAEVDIVPKVMGILEKLRLPDARLLEEGATVEQGQIIAVIEHSALEAAANQARASLDVAKAALERAKVNLEDADSEKKRWEQLYARESASEQKREQAVLAYKRAQVEVSLSSSQIEQAQATLSQAEVNLKEATVTAPISGVVSRKYVDEGSMVGPGIPLVRIVQIDTVKVVGSISELHVASIVPSRTQVRLVTDALPGEEIRGTVFMIGVDADPLTRTVKLETRIPNPEGKLKSGMFVRMMVDLEIRENVPVAPDTALVRQGAHVFVYVVKESRVERRKVILGIAEGGRHEVLEGLKPGEAVMVRGQQLIKDGDQVEVFKEE